MTPTDCPPTIDPQAALRWSLRAAAPSPWLHEEVGQRMAQRLQWIKQEPRAWLDWQAMRGGLKAHQAVQARYPKSERFVLETSMEHRQLAIKSIALRWWNPAHWGAGPVHFCVPPDGTVNMVWANMALHHARDPASCMRAWHRALAVDGFLMFSCFGPDTLRELRQMYASLGWPAPAHDFTDMHDWGDMLVAAGFAEPVMDMERITLSFDSAERLLVELRGLGRNLHVGRFPGLRGRSWRQQLGQALTDSLADPADGGRLKLTFEINYGHAFKPAPRLSVQARTAFSVDELRHSLRKGRTGAAKAPP